jgi:hypothetical protein
MGVLMTTAITKATPQWTDKDYLVRMFLGPWLNCSYDSDKVTSELDKVATFIAHGKKYGLLSDYYNYFLNPTPYDSFLLQTTYLGDFNSEWVRADSEVITKCTKALAYIQDCISGSKGKLLIGAKNSIPLWTDIPESWRRYDQEMWEWRFDGEYKYYLLRLLALFSGADPQQRFDRLLLPQVDKWACTTDWTLNRATKFVEKVARLLGYADGFVSLTDVENILARTYLEKKFTLSNDRPVLIRLENNPIINQVILAMKGDYLVGKICTFSYGELLHIQSVSNMRYPIIDPVNILDVFIAKLQIEEYGNLEHGKALINWALGALVTTIYHDLVTVEEKEICTRRTAIQPTADPKKPKPFITSWQYIPRRHYVYNRPNDNSLVDREPLSETELQKQRAIRKWHMVCGHIRRYRNKPDWMASGDKQGEALADGIILRTGETYVRPHARNKGALEELGEIDINSIPHYMRRGR